MTDITPLERQLLRGLRARPMMYLGSYSLRQLENFLGGYGAALHNHDLGDQVCILPQAFHRFVTERYGQPGPKGWCRSILEAVPDGKEAIETFFRLLDEFLEAEGFARLAQPEKPDAL